MTNQKMPWLRLYVEIVDDDKLGLLAFEDRWHYVALLCCKRAGLLDADCDDQLLRRRVAYKLGLAVREMEEVLRRISEVGLVDKETMQPLGWEERQFISDTDPTATDRKRRQRERENGVTDVSRVTPVTVTRTETETETDLETPKAKASAPSARKMLEEEGLPKELILDFLRVRQKIKAEFTPTALKGFKREADKAGISLEDAIRIATESSWRGFKAEWLKPEQRGHSQQERPKSAMREMVERMQEIAHGGG